MASNKEGKLFGAYLADDEINKEFICAGKSTDGGGCVAVTPTKMTLCSTL